MGKLTGDSEALQRLHVMRLRPLPRETLFPKQKWTFRHSGLVSLPSDLFQMVLAVSLFFLQIFKTRISNILFSFFSWFLRLQGVLLTTET